jgi:Fic family protein
MKRDDLSHSVRQRLKRYEPPYENHYGVVPAPPPEGAISTIEIADRCRAADRALITVEILASRMPDRWLVSRILPRREAVSSSAIENTNSTLDELLSVEEAGTAASPGAAAQVRDYARALDDLVPEAAKRGHAIFSVDLVRRLHRTTMRADAGYGDQPGELRNGVVWIGGTGDIAYSTFNPAPPGDVVACLEHTMAYMRCEGMQIMHQPLLTRMAIAHAHFEAVHPFKDGNGRVGRLLLPLMMAAEGTIPLYLSPYIEAHKDAYYASLKAAQRREVWHALVGFLADAVVGTVGEVLDTQKALEELRRIWEARRKFRRGSASSRALDLLPHYPVLTAPRLASLLTVTPAAARIAIDQLTEVRILTEKTGYRTNRIFAASEVLTIINRPFGATPVLPGANDWNGD